MTPKASQGPVLVQALRRAFLDAAPLTESTGTLDVIARKVPQTRRKLVCKQCNAVAASGCTPYFRI